MVSLSGREENGSRGGSATVARPNSCPLHLQTGVPGKLSLGLDQTTTDFVWSVWQKLVIETRHLGRSYVLRLWVAFVENSR